MKFLLLSILIFFLSGCTAAKGTHYEEGLFTIPFGQTEVTYTTPYGIIEKGYTAEQVKAVLGNPLRISAYGNAENWYYNFGKDKRLFVYFMDGKVTMVRSKEDVEM